MPRGEKTAVSEDRIAELFEQNGWKVDRSVGDRHLRPDLLVRKGNKLFVVEVKSVSEGRPDRAIPLLSQAILQARAYARKTRNAKPLAIIYVDHASTSLLKQIERFATDFVTDAAVGMVSGNGASYFQGDGLEVLNAAAARSTTHVLHLSPFARDLFSDLNQWMLKVLLSPHIPENLLTAPRPAGGLRNASDLASTAGVSVMSAFRFVSELKKEGFLDEAADGLKLVRTNELLHRWRAASLRSSTDTPMRFLLASDRQSQLRRLVTEHHACLGLFAAADALKLGLVKGVPPYVYHSKQPAGKIANWKELTIAGPGESPQLLLRQARSPQSVFRGAVSVNGMPVSDVIQIWLDVSAHPSRGREQAELIQRKVFRPFIQGEI